MGIEFEGTIHIQPEVSGSGTPIDAYTKEETDTLLDNRIEPIEEVIPSDASSSNQLATISDIPDLTNYYTKTQTDTLLDDKADVSDIPDVTQINANIEELQENVFKTDYYFNGTIQGENIVDSDGKLSNFEPYPQLAYSNEVIEFKSTDTWEIVTSFTTADSIAIRQSAVANFSSPALDDIYVANLEINNGQLVSWLSSDPTRWNIMEGGGATTLSPNTYYTFRQRFDGSKYYFDQLINNNWVNRANVSSSNKITTPFRIVYGQSATQTTGSIASIDYINCYVKVNGEKVWDGATYGLNHNQNTFYKKSEVDALLDNKANISDIPDISNLATKTELTDGLTPIENAVYYNHPHFNGTLYGTALDDEGVVSNLTSGNYAVGSTLIDVGSNSWEYVVSFKTGQDVTTRQSVAGTKIGDTVGAVGFALELSPSGGGNLICWLSTNGSSWDVFAGVGSTVLTPNTEYKCKIGYTISGGSGTYTYYLNSGSGYELKGQRTFNASLQYDFYPCYAGVFPFLGDINANEAQIKIGVDIAWSGIAISLDKNTTSFYTKSETVSSTSALTALLPITSTEYSQLMPDSGTLYIITDTGAIYLGTTLIAQKNT